MSGQTENGNGRSIPKPTAKGTAISVSATGLGLLINWLWSMDPSRPAMSTDVGIVLAGGVAFVLSWFAPLVTAARDWLIRKMSNHKSP